MVLRLVVDKVKGEGSRMDWVFGVCRCKLLYLEWISNGILLYSTWNSVKVLGVEHGRRSYEKKNVFLTESLCSTVEIGTTHKSTIL